MTKLKILTIILFSITIFCYVLYRAHNLSITYDESYSYLNFISKSYSDIIHYTAESPTNNHLLNSLLTKPLVDSFTISSLTLRAPNITAFLVYLISAFLLSNRHKKGLLIFLEFALLVLNPFILDFFSLSRGYGLALAFQLFSILSLYLYLKSKKIKYASLSAISSSLTVLANISFFNFFAPLSIILIYFLIRNYPKVKNKLIFLSSISLNLALLLATTIYTYIVGSYLQKENQLYYGGKNGFMEDTLKSLINSWFYNHDISELNSNIILSLIIFSFIIGTFQILYMVKKRHFKDFYLIAYLLLISTILINILQHLIIGTNFLIERTAILYFPLFFVFIGSLLKIISSYKNNKLILSLSTLLIAFVFFNFFYSINTRYTISWKFDANTKTVSKLINQEKQNKNTPKLKILSNSLLQSSLQYYLETEGPNEYNLQLLESIEPGTIINNQSFDAVFLFQDQKGLIDSSGFTNYIEFDESNTYLSY